MDEELMLSERELMSISVPSFGVPDVLRQSTIRFSWESANFNSIVLSGISAIPAGSNPMVEITNVHSVMFYRGENFVLKVDMRMNELKSSASIEVTQKQLEQIVKKALSVQYGDFIVDTKLIKLDHNANVFCFEVIFKERD